MEPQCQINAIKAPVNTKSEPACSVRGGSQVFQETRDYWGWKSSFRGRQISAEMELFLLCLMYYAPFPRCKSALWRVIRSITWQTQSSQPTETGSTAGLGCQCLDLQNNPSSMGPSEVPSPTSCSKQEQRRDHSTMVRAWASWVAKTSKERDQLTCLGNLFQYPTIQMVKKFPHIIKSELFFTASNLSTSFGIYGFSSPYSPVMSPAFHSKHLTLWQRNKCSV